MNTIGGSFMPFEDYLQRTKRSRVNPQLWSWSAIAGALARCPIGERGSIALCHGSVGECPSSAPGLSTTIQVVACGARTTPHAHSFWHLYLVRSGRGQFMTDAAEPASMIALGDILFIPAWSVHSFVNAEKDEALVLIAVQNLPQMAESGTLVRAGVDGCARPVFSDFETVATEGSGTATCEKTGQPVTISSVPSSPDRNYSTHGPTDVFREQDELARA